MKHLLRAPTAAFLTAVLVAAPAHAAADGELTLELPEPVCDPVLDLCDLAETQEAFLPRRSSGLFRVGGV